MISSLSAGLSLDQELKYLPTAATEGLSWGANTQNVAATEQCPLRRRLISGEVHDLNAAAMGGVAPHAGLLGHCRTLLALALAT